MRFFVNNQYKTIVDGETNGSDNLENIFARRLQRIGRVVAPLDTGDDSVYLRRIWAIFEQHTALKLLIPVRFAIPDVSAQEMLSPFKEVEVGIFRVREAFRRIDSATAKASVAKDEEKVKDICAENSFGEFEKTVGRYMAGWVAETIHNYMQELVFGEA